MRRLSMVRRFVAALLLLFPLTALTGADEPKAGDKNAAEKKHEEPFSAATFGGLKMRLVGPAVTSGRIADFAVHPQDRGHYYAAAASGGVWKTTNAGTTWTPVFDDQGSYSIGTVVLDPKNPHVVWVGTGEF